MSDQQNQRIEKINKLRKKGINPYPNNFKPTHDAIEIIDIYEDLEEGSHSENVIKCAGRLISKRGHGKVYFANIQSNGTSIQIYAKLDILGQELFDFFTDLDIGDIIGVVGKIFRTRTGELTIMLSDIKLLTKALRPLPEKWHGLKDVEIRYRQRYLDLISNKDARDVFLMRSNIIYEIREMLKAFNFIEVETPMMHPIPGGSTARPFKTYHNSLDKELYLRIAPELYLKRLVVGGFDRVYELNRNFRNEGISTEHNPEFTMLEFYMAYADYKDLMEFTENLFYYLSNVLKNNCNFDYQGTNLNFLPPWTRLTMHEAILKYNNTLSCNDLNDPNRLIEEIKKYENLEGNESLGKLIMKLFEITVEPNLIQPTFITDFPRDISPLARPKDNDPSLVERFELYITGREIANAFSELNDPIDQNERFCRQVLEGGEENAKVVDKDYIEALEYGLPPTAGEGIGIDRLVMIFANVPSIKEVILFPQLR